MPNLFQRNPALRQRYPSPPRKQSKILDELRDPENAHYARLAREDAKKRDKKLSKMDKPKKKPVKSLSASPAKKIPKKRRDPLEWGLHK